MNKKNEEFAENLNLNKPEVEAQINSLNANETQWSGEQMYVEPNQMNQGGYQGGYPGYNQQNAQYGYQQMNGGQQYYPPQVKKPSFFKKLFNSKQKALMWVCSAALLIGIVNTILLAVVVSDDNGFRETNKVMIEGGKYFNQYPDGSSGGGFIHPNGGIQERGQSFWQTPEDSEQESSYSSGYSFN